MRIKVAFPWNRLIRQYIEREQLPEELFSELLRLVRSVAHGLPAFVYSPLPVWDEDAYRTCASDVLDTQVKQGRLEKLTYWPDWYIDRYIRRAIKWYLHALAHHRGARCLALFQTIRLILRRERMVSFSADGREVSILNTAGVLGDDRAAVRLPDYAASGPKSWPLPDQRALTLFLKNFLAAHENPVLLKDLVMAAESHFGVCDGRESPWPVSIDPDTGKQESMDIADPRSRLGQLEVETRHEVRKFIERLWLRRMVLRAVFVEGLRQDEVAVRMKYSKSTISLYKCRIEKELKKLGLCLEPEAISVVKRIFAEELERAEAMLSDRDLSPSR